MKKKGGTTGDGGEEAEKEVEVKKSEIEEGKKEDEVVVMLELKDKKTAKGVIH